MNWFTYFMLAVFTQSVKSMKPYPGDLLRIGNEDDVYANEDVTSLANLVEETDESFVDLEKVTFILYDRLNFTNQIPLKIGMKHLPEIFNPNYDTIFTVHSWVAGPYIMEDIVEGYIQTGKDYNLMAADWSPASGAGIIVSSLIAADIGDKIAEFIDFLSTKGLSPSKIILIGYSLGCHVAGTAGFRVTSGRVGTIIDICSHCRSKDYFVESITSPIIFNATLCYSWNDYIKGRCKENPTVAMGAYTPTSARGRYYLSTNSESPFTQESSYVAV